MASPQVKIGHRKSVEIRSLAAGKETFRTDPVREMWLEGEILLSARLAAVPWRPKKAASTASKPQSAVLAVNLKWGELVKYLNY